MVEDWQEDAERWYFMIRVTSTLIVHRPERLLYYLPEPTEEVKNCIADGVCPDELQKYQYAFPVFSQFIIH